MQELRAFAEDVVVGYKILWLYRVIRTVSVFV